MDLSTLFANKNPMLDAEEMTVQSDSALVIRFPAPKTVALQPNDVWPRWQRLFPQKWKRRVIIQGKHFWLPG